MNKPLDTVSRLVALAMVLLVSAGAAPPARGEARLLVEPAAVGTVAISPDGKHLAMVRGGDDKDTVAIVQRPAMTIVAGVSSPKGERFHSVTWASSGTLLVETAFDRGPFVDPLPTGRLIGLTVDGVIRNFLQVAVAAKQLPSVVVNVLPEEPDHVLIAAPAGCLAEPGTSAGDSGCGGAQSTLRRLQKLELPTGDRTDVAGEPPVGGYYVTDSSGRQILLAGRASSGQVEVYRWAGSSWQSVTGFDPAEDLGIVPYAVGMRGELYALANKRGTAALYRWDLGSGDATEIFRDSVTDVDDRITSWDGQRLLAVRAEPGFPTWHYLEESGRFAELHRALRAAFSDSDVDVTSMTADGSELIIRVHNERNAGDFYIVNAKTRDTELLAQSRPDVQPGRLATVEPITVASRDGFTLRGYLAVPPDIPRPHPLVVWLHDNPYTSRARWQLDPELQLLVSSGYAVLQINYRGSGGLGQWYSASGGERDGRAVQRDIADSARWAVSQNITTEQQICVLGRGYGGFAALKSLIDNVGLFKCGVGIDGFYDLTSAPEVPEARTLTPQSLLAVPTRLDMTNPSRAPIARVDRIGASVMLVGQGEATMAMRTALTDASKALVWRADDGGLDGYRDIVAFLDRHIKGGAAVTEDEAPSFAMTLTERQSRAFRKIVAAMEEDVSDIAYERVRSVGALRRELRRIVAARDDDVRALVSDEQWELYGDFRADMLQRFEQDLDMVRLR